MATELSLALLLLGCSITVGQQQNAVPPSKRKPETHEDRRPNITDSIPPEVLENFSQKYQQAKIEAMRRYEQERPPIATEPPAEQCTCGHKLLLI